MHAIKPIDKGLIKKLKKIKKVITVEEHNIIGGLGSAICEFLQENNIQIPVERRIGIRDKYSKSGSYEYLKYFKIDSASLEKILLKNYEKLQKKYKDIFIKKLEIKPSKFKKVLNIMIYQDGTLLVTWG